MTMLLGVYISLNFWEGVMAQAYIKLELLEFPSNYCDSSCQCAANIRPKKLLKSSVSLSFTCDI